MITMKQMLEAGAHFGHQTKRWNPKMKPYIFGARNGIYIIDLQQTVGCYKRAHEVVVNAVANGGKVMFVGTKKQAAEIIAEEAERCGMWYVNNRWLGGMITNFMTVRKSIEKYNSLQEMYAKDNWGPGTKKEQLLLSKLRVKMEKSLAGLSAMDGAPAVVFVIDPQKEKIAVHEANKLGIPVIAVTDTNCDPDPIDFIIPSNDDAIRAIKLFAGAIADAVLEGKQLFEENLRTQRHQKDEVVRAKAIEAVQRAAVVSADDAAPPDGVAISVKRAKRKAEESAAVVETAAAPEAAAPEAEAPKADAPAETKTEE